MSALPRGIGTPSRDATPRQPRRPATMNATALALFGATFATVFALGLQSLNVNGGHVRLAIATSFAIGSMNLVLFKLLPGPTGLLDILAYLVGGPLGIAASMATHPWLLRRLGMSRRHATKHGAVGAHAGDLEVAELCERLARALGDRACMSVLIHLLKCAEHELRAGRCPRLSAAGPLETARPPCQRRNLP